MTVWFRRDGNLLNKLVTTKENDRYDFGYYPDLLHLLQVWRVAAPPLRTAFTHTSDSSDDFQPKGLFALTQTFDTLGSTVILGSMLCSMCGSSSVACFEGVYVKKIVFFSEKILVLTYSLFFYRIKKGIKEMMRLWALGEPGMSILYPWGFIQPVLSKGQKYLILKSWYIFSNMHVITANSKKLCGLDVC